MDAVEFLKSYRRICDSNACTKCPLWVDEHYACMMDAKIIEAAQVDENRAVSAVEQWSKENPVKTRQSEFMKVFPNARVFIDGILDFCPQEIDKCYPCQSTDIEMRCQSCRRDYWLQEVRDG